MYQFFLLLLLDLALSEVFNIRTSLFVCSIGILLGHPKLESRGEIEIYDKLN